MRRDCVAIAAAAMALSFGQRESTAISLAVGFDKMPSKKKLGMETR
jgi:hypothetical protein